jgi:hypothetical protein
MFRVSLVPFLGDEAARLSHVCKKAESIGKWEKDIVVFCRQFT